MIIVDTTVWIEFFGASGSRYDLHLSELIKNGESLGLTDLIYCEILQGIREDASYARLRTILQSYPILQLHDLHIVEEAATIYRDCRKRGITIRKTIDCLIAATCLDAGAELFHNDRDFDAIVRVRNLKIHRP